MAASISEPRAAHARLLALRAVPKPARLRLCARRRRLRADRARARAVVSEHPARQPDARAARARGGARAARSAPAQVTRLTIDLMRAAPMSRRAHRGAGGARGQRGGGARGGALRGRRGLRARERAALPARRDRGAGRSSPASVRAAAARHARCASRGARRARACPRTRCSTCSRCGRCPASSQPIAWLRLRVPLVAGEENSPLVRVAYASDMTYSVPLMRQMMQARPRGLRAPAVRRDQPRHHLEPAPAGRGRVDLPRRAGRATPRTARARRSRGCSTRAARSATRRSRCSCAASRPRPRAGGASSAERDADRAADRARRCSLLVAGFAAITWLALESGGVAVIETRAPDGTTHATHVWTVERDGALWLEAGSPSNAWFADLTRDPHLRLRVDGATRDAVAEIVPEKSRRDPRRAARRSTAGATPGFRCW